MDRAAQGAAVWLAPVFPRKHPESSLPTLLSLSHGAGGNPLSKSHMGAQCGADSAPILACWLVAAGPLCPVQTVCADEDVSPGDRELIVALTRAACLKLS